METLSNVWHGLNLQPEKLCRVLCRGPRGRNYTVNMGVAPVRMTSAVQLGAEAYSSSKSCFFWCNIKWALPCFGKISVNILFNVCLWLYRLILKILLSKRMCVFLMGVSVLPAHMCLALCGRRGYRGWRRALQPRGREPWRAVNRSARAGNPPWVLCKSHKCSGLLRRLSSPLNYFQLSKKC